MAVCVADAPRNPASANQMVESVAELSLHDPLPRNGWVAFHALMAMRYAIAWVSQSSLQTVGPGRLSGWLCLVTF